MQHHVIETPWDELYRSECSADEKRLIDAAIEASRHAYAPISHYFVGAAVLCRDGTIFPGSNQENYCVSPTAHAERIACHSAGANGKGDQIQTLVCLTSDERRHIAPCPGCLEVMAEYEHRARQQMLILFGAYNGKTIARVKGVRALAPMSFLPEDLYEVYEEGQE